MTFGGFLGQRAQDLVAGTNTVIVDTIAGATKGVNDLLGGQGNAIDKLANQAIQHPTYATVLVAGSIYAYSTLAAAQQAAAAGGGTVVGQGLTAQQAANASSTGTILSGANSAVSAVVNTVGPMVKTISDSVKSVTDFIKNINTNVIQPIVGPIQSVVENYKALSTAIQADIHGGIQGILQLPSDIANAFTSVDAAFQRAMATLSKANADTTAKLILPAIPGAALQGLTEHTNVFKDTFPGAGVDWQPPGKVKLTETPNVEQLTEEIDQVTQWLASGSTWYTQIGWTILKFLTVLPGLWASREPVLESYRQEVYKALPVLNLSQGDVITLYRMGIINYDDAISELATNGMNESRSRALMESAVTYPDVGTALSMYQRGLITEHVADEILITQGYNTDSIKVMKESIWKVPDPVAALDWWRRGIITKEDLTLHLEANGYRGGVADAIIEASWKLPDIQSIIQAESNQTLISSGAAGASMQESAPPPLREQAAQQGINETLADLAWQLHYKPLPLSLAVEAYWRGFLSESELNAHFDAAGLLPSQRQNYMETLRPKLTIRQYQALNKLGIITDVEYTAQMEGLGYSLVEVEWINKLDQAQQAAPAQDVTNAVHGLTYSTVEQLYQQGVIDNGTASGLLKELGWGDEAITATLALYDAKNYAAQLTAQANLIVSQTKAGIYTYDEAVGQLQQLGLSTTQLNKALTSLQGQLADKSKLPGEGTVIQMYRHKVLSRDETASALQLNGYSAGWSELLIQLDEAQHGIP